MSASPRRMCARHGHNPKTTAIRNCECGAMMEAVICARCGMTRPLPSRCEKCQRILRNEVIDGSRRLNIEMARTCAIAGDYEKAKAHARKLPTKYAVKLEHAIDELRRGRAAQ